ncbi:MAG: hypothetical protein EAZ16_11735 [Sphingobacteriales bacterium]|jgi:hypothetical protein|nr:MAG: hypothetical protein EAZ16_11735 [Sphingobacteriales bacterium]
MQKNCTRVYSSAAPLSVITILNNSQPVASTETRQHFVPSAPTDAIINRKSDGVKKINYSYYYKARNN